MELLYLNKNTHGNNFDFLRFMLATLVVFTHSYVVYEGRVDNEPLWMLSHQQLGFGTLALNSFFLTSGFLVSQSWRHSKGYLDFLKKRVLRIYPGFITVCFVGAYVFAPLGLGIIRPIHYIVEYWSYVNVRDLAYTSLKLGSPELPETFKTSPCYNDVNTSLWTIPYEFVCYQFVPLLALLRHRITPLVIFALVFALNVYHYNDYQYYNVEGTIKSTFLPHFIQRRLSDETLDLLLNFEHFFGFFMAGVCFYAYRNYIPRSIYLATLALIVMLVATFWVKVFELAQLVFGAYLLFYFAYSKRVRIHNFARYGDFSYGIYLYGWPIQQLVLLYFGPKVGIMGIFFISMIFAFAAAYTSWHFIEKPFLSLKTKQFRLAEAPV